MVSNVHLQGITGLGERGGGGGDVGLEFLGVSWVDGLVLRLLRLFFSVEIGWPGPRSGGLKAAAVVTGRTGIMMSVGMP